MEDQTLHSPPRTTLSRHTAGRLSHSLLDNRTEHLDPRPESLRLLLDLPEETA